MNKQPKKIIKVDRNPEESKEILIERIRRIKEALANANINMDIYSITSLLLLSNSTIMFMKKCSNDEAIEMCVNMLRFFKENMRERQIRCERCGQMMVLYQ